MGNRRFSLFARVVLWTALGSLPLAAALYWQAPPWLDLVIWAAGVSGNPAIREWGIPIGRGGRIEVNSDLRVLGEEDIFAVGDISLTVDTPLPQLAQPAIQTGKFAAKQIARLHRGAPTEKFEYHNKGTMATIGRGDAVLQTPFGLKLKGVPAWLGWIGLHIVYNLVVSTLRGQIAIDSEEGVGTGVTIDLPVTVP